ncbi:Succinyl-CoA:(R)-benzylsuccinate CoA-transferase subunit BbsF [subsurface metagenome]
MDVTLNLSQPKGVWLAKEVARVCDVVLENFRPGVMRRLGLDYEALKEVRPDIIYLSSSCRGGTGPEWNYAGYAPNFAALGGLSYVTGHLNGVPSVVTSRTDLLVGTTSFFAILAALIYRSKTGKGQYIDVSSSEVQSVLVGDMFMEYAMNKRNPQRQGNRDSIMAPHNCYRCKGEDKWISIAVSTEEEWQALCDAMGNPEWTKDDKFCDAYSRKKNEDELDRLISQWTINYTHYEVMGILQQAGVAALPSFNSQELHDDPHVKERGIITEVVHPVIGKQKVIGNPWKLSASSANVSGYGPLFGEHNQYVFGELLGMSPEEIQSLVQEQVIY